MMAVGGGITLATSSLAAGIGREMTAADEMGKMASKFGLPVDLLSRLAFVADQSGASMTTVGTAIGSLSRNMVAFAEGRKPVVAVFKSLGISATDLEGKLRPTQDVLMDVADAFHNMEDGPAKTAAAIELFDERGSR